MLLSRVAESLYWSARYLERAEDTARIVIEHTNVLVDLPTSTALTWAPLLAIPGIEGDADHPVATDERSIIRLLIADWENSSSVAACIALARENLRTCREIIPTGAWEVVNDLFLYMSTHADEGVARQSRIRMLRRVMHDINQSTGIIAGTMNRDDAYEFMRIGRNVERADMTTRVIDVRAGSLIGTDNVDPYAGVQWTGVLRSLSALQAYHRSTHSPVVGAEVVEFLLSNLAFPRSVAHCVNEIEEALSHLPHPHAGLRSERTIRGLLVAQPEGIITAESLHTLADNVQISLGQLHQTLAATYFATSTAPH
jgi:uncharacterized alpha-E superfamily protein